MFAKRNIPVPEFVKVLVPPKIFPPVLESVEEPVLVIELVVPFNVVPSKNRMGDETVNGPFQIADGPLLNVADEVNVIFWLVVPLCVKRCNRSSPAEKPEPTEIVLPEASVAVPVAFSQK